MKKIILSASVIVSALTYWNTSTESFALNPTKKLEIGSKYQGGVIAYILQAGDAGFDAKETHGIIVAPADEKEELQWFNGTYIEMVGDKGTAIGTGKSNTDTIVSRQGEGTYAAKICADLVLDGFSDWYLPSKDELNQIYKNMALLPNFDGKKNYWSSSSEANVFYAYRQGFFTGSQKGTDKKTKQAVRAVRSF
jgi:Protein of unknown function (DUF1566)